MKIKKMQSKLDDATVIVDAYRSTLAPQDPENKDLDKINGALYKAMDVLGDYKKLQKKCDKREEKIEELKDQLKSSFSLPTGEQRRKAEQVLIDSGIDTAEADAVLQAVGYALLNKDLYPDYDPKDGDDYEDYDEDEDEEYDGGI